MALPPAFLDEIRNRVTLSSVVGRHVKLTRSGRELAGCCPFHVEKTPSFTVNDEKGFVHCFGCGVHEDVIGFTMRLKGLAFPDAVEELAREAGLEPPRRDPEAARRYERATTMAQVVEAAAVWFEERLWAGDAEGSAARAYLAGRGVSEETARRWRLGWAPPGGKAIVRRLTQDLSLAVDLCVDAGVLFRADDGGSRSFFRRRVIFPIADRRGRLVGFGGRLIDGEGPKYLNTGDTPLFDKGASLFGGQHLRAAVGEGKPVLVVEGYLDVITLHQAGWSGAVAPLGTALTPAQIKRLFDAAPDDRALTPILMLDGDEAGRRASSRAIERALPLLRPGRSLAFAALPDGEDPDSLIRSGRESELGAAVAAARSLADKLWTDDTAAADLGTPEGRAAVIRAARARLEAIVDPSVRTAYAGEYKSRLRGLLGVDVDMSERRERRSPRPRSPVSAGADLTIAARELWSRRAPLAGTPAGMWLRARAVSLDAVREDWPTLGAGDCEYVIDGRDGASVGLGRRPVLMGGMARWTADGQGRVCAVALLYLDSDGRRLRLTDEATGRDLPSSRVIGDAAGAAVRLSPLVGEHLVVAVGLDTAVLTKRAHADVGVWCVPGVRSAATLRLPDAAREITLIGVDRARPEWRDRAVAHLRSGGRRVRVAVVDLVAAGRAARERDA